MRDRRAIAEALGRGMVIPACPLALNAGRRWDERRQRVLCRYYRAGGADGLAVGVHTTQFSIRDPKVGLYRPLLELTREEMDRADAQLGRPSLRVGGVCGPTSQATAEAQSLRELGFHAGLLSLAGHGDRSEDDLLRHCHEISEIVPLFGFYLQPAVGGRVLSFSFWRRFAEIPDVVAVKIAPFNRYQTLDVIRAISEAGRGDIALYTGNDDNIVLDLLTPYRFTWGDRVVERRIVGGLLGQWAVWTRRAADLLEQCHHFARTHQPVPVELLRLAVELTDANAAIFDAANGFAGCIPGIHEVLRRQGLLEGVWCLDPQQNLSPGQKQEIDRVYRTYPHLNDDSFVRDHLDQWLED